jgi:hypothetical protein
MQGCMLGLVNGPLVDTSLQHSTAWPTTMNVCRPPLHVTPNTDPSLTCVLAVFLHLSTKVHTSSWHR